MFSIFLLDSYLFIMPLELADRWIQFVERNHFDTQVFANIPVDGESESVRK